MTQNHLTNSQLFLCSQHETKLCGTIYFTLTVPDGNALEYTTLI